jgi:hypothetical protein
MVVLNPGACFTPVASGSMKVAVAGCIGHGGAGGGGW